MGREILHKFLSSSFHRLIRSFIFCIPASFVNSLESLFYVKICFIVLNLYKDDMLIKEASGLLEYGQLCNSSIPV